MLFSAENGTLCWQRYENLYCANVARLAMERPSLRRQSVGQHPENKKTIDIYVCAQCVCRVLDSLVLNQLDRPLSCLSTFISCRRPKTFGSIKQLKRNKYKLTEAEELDDGLADWLRKTSTLGVHSMVH